MTILALPTYYGYSENYKAFYCKDRIAPTVYASVGLCHNYIADDTDDYKKLGRRLDDAVYDKFFAFCEEKQLPITMHIGDPTSFWDWENATDIQKKKGWVYSEKDPSLEQLRSEAFGILKKFR